MRSALIVFVGSGFGGTLRHLVGLAALRWLGPQFPYGTMAINIAGSALMGLVAGLFAGFGTGQADLRLFLTTGILGGFTTWSTFSLDTVTLWERGYPIAAATYVLGSMIVSFATLAAMLLLTRRWG